MDWSSFWGAFIGNIADIAIIFILIRGMKRLACMMKQFKAEGDPEKWQK